MGFVYKLFRDHNKKIHLGLPKLAGNNLAIEAENLPLLEGFLQDYESKGWGDPLVYVLGFQPEAGAHASMDVTLGEVWTNTLIWEPLSDGILGLWSKWRWAKQEVSKSLNAFIGHTFPPWDCFPLWEGSAILFFFLDNRGTFHGQALKTLYGDPNLEILTILQQP